MKKTIALIDYESGNLHSAAKALEAADDQATVNITKDPKSLRDASHIVLPGVGAYGDCITGLKAIDGMVEELEEAVLQHKTPFFGICVGMQMLSETGEEHGTHQGLGWFKGSVKKINNQDRSLIVPHMGWNELILDQPNHPILTNIGPNQHAYFVHSYHFDCQEDYAIIAKVEYGTKLVAILAKDNIIATQFHPEKSQKTGITLLQNFLQL